MIILKFEKFYQKSVNTVDFMEKSEKLAVYKMNVSDNVWM